LDLFSQGLVERESGGWKITDKGRAVLEYVEARPEIDQPIDAIGLEQAESSVETLRLPAERAQRRRQRRERRREARDRAREKAS
jgi:hypothetical protein